MFKPITMQERLRREEAKNRKLLGELQETREQLKEAEDALLEVAGIIGGEDGENLPAEN
jgi:hypothetical protein